MRKFELIFRIQTIEKKVLKARKITIRDGGSHTLTVSLFTLGETNQFFLGKSPKLWVGGGQEPKLVKM